MSKVQKFFVSVFGVVFVLGGAYLLSSKKFSQLNSSRAAGKTYTVGVVKFIDIQAFEDIEESFIEELKKLSRKRNITVEFEKQILQNDFKKSEESLKEMTQKPIDLLFTIGTVPALQAASFTKENPIPVLYSGTPAPQESHIVESLEASGTNITGTSVKVPMNAQMQTLKRVLPEAQRLGILYSQSAPAPILADEARIAAEKLGLTVESISLLQENTELIPPAIADIAEKIDALYLPPNSFLYAPTQFDRIIKESAFHRLPVIVGTPEEVSRGALFSLHANFKESGEQGAQLAAKILFDGENPGTIPSRVPSNYHLTINKKTAETLGIKLPEAILELAHQIIE